MENSVNTTSHHKPIIITINFDILSLIQSQILKF